MLTSKQAEAVKARIAEANPEALFFDDCDRALIGPGNQYGATPVLAVYSYDALIEVFAEKFSNEEDPHTAAIEWVEANVACAYIGPMTPIIVNVGTDED